MELESSSLYPQKPATCPYSEPTPSSLHDPLQLPENPSKYYHPIYVLVSLIASFPQTSPPTPCALLYLPPYAPLGLANSFPSSLFMRAGQGHSSGLHCSKLWRTICVCRTASVALGVSRARKTLDEGNAVCLCMSNTVMVTSKSIYYNMAPNKNMGHSWNYPSSHFSSPLFMQSEGSVPFPKTAEHKNLSWTILTLKSRSKCTIRPFMGLRVQ
jgi:hypothetical protein